MNYLLSSSLYDLIIEAYNSLETKMKFHTFHNLKVVVIRYTRYKKSRRSPMEESW